MMATDDADRGLVLGLLLFLTTMMTDHGDRDLDPVQGGARVFLDTISGERGRGWCYSCSNVLIVIF